MKDNKPFFSFLTTFRNRSLEHLKRNLDAIQEQSYQNFEVIFVNSGSEENTTKDLEKLLTNYDFITTYIYTETRGYDWNKSHALNISISGINNKVLIINDIEVIFPSNFLEKILKIWDFREILIYRLYYLPKNFTQYELIKKEPYKLCKKLENSKFTAKGALIFQKKVFEDVGGYDEFYRVWGVEDADFLEMAAQKGYNYRFWTEERVPIFHQWHEKTGPKLVNNFMKVHQRHFEAKKARKIRSQALLDKTKARKPLTILDRPVLQKVLNQDFANSLQFQFEVPREDAYLLFTKQFKELKSGGYLLVQQEFAEFSNSKSRLKGIMKFCNQILKKVNISYRLVELQKSEQEYFEWGEVQNFLRYFTVHFSEYLKDYYFKCEYPKVFLLLLKK